MGEKKVIFYIFLLCFGISCGSGKRNSVRESLPYYELESANDKETRPEEHQQIAQTEPSNLVKEKKKTAAQDDNKILDERVFAMALSLGKSPESYRMLIRTDSDGTKIYRQVGKYVILYPDQEVIYVPDGA